MMAQITVIVPVYNVGPYLERCLNSIVTQHFRDYDVVLIDDGSSDGSGKLCDQYAAQYPYIHVIHQENKGLSAARNAGIEWSLNHSDSHYLTFVDSDDWIHPDYLGNLLEAMNQSGCDVSVSQFVRTKDDFLWHQEHSLSFEIINPEVLYMKNPENFITAWGKLFQKKEFSELRFPVGRIHEDAFVIWKIMLKEAKVALVDQKLYAYCIRGDSITRRVWTEERLVLFDALEELNCWIDEHGSKELQEYVRRRKAKLCADQVRGMQAAGVSDDIIHMYRRKLIEYIKDARPSLRFGEYRMVYKTAWPRTSSVVWFAYRVFRKIVWWKH